MRSGSDNSPAQPLMLTGARALRTTGAGAGRPIYVCDARVLEPRAPTLDSAVGDWIPGRIGTRPLWLRVAWPVLSRFERSAGSGLASRSSTLRVAGQSASIGLARLLLLEQPREIRANASPLWSDPTMTLLEATGDARFPRKLRRALRAQESERQRLAGWLASVCWRRLGGPSAS